MPKRLSNSKLSNLPLDLKRIPLFFLYTINILFQPQKTSYRLRKPTRGHGHIAGATTLPHLPLLLSLQPNRRRISINTHLLPTCSLDANGRAGAGCEPEASAKAAPQLPVFAALGPPPVECSLDRRRARLHLPPSLQPNRRRLLWRTRSLPGGSLSFWVLSMTGTSIGSSSGWPGRLLLSGMRHRVINLRGQLPSCFSFLKRTGMYKRICLFCYWNYTTAHV